MSVVVVEPPAPVVTVADMKAHLNVQSDDDDVLISAYVAAATASLDGPTGWLGRAIGQQTLEMAMRGWGDGWLPCAGIRLPYPPITSIVSVKYFDPDGVERVLDPSFYSLDYDTFRAAPNSGAWPASRLSWGDNWHVRYRAGYATVPASISTAIKLMAADYYANREAAVVAPAVARVDNPAILALLGPLRIWS